MLQATRAEIAAAFEEWLRRYTKEPGRYSAEYGEPAQYGEGCADYLGQIITEQRAARP